MSDQELLERYHNEHDNAWMGILLQRYTLLLFGVCYKYLKDEEDAKDAVQQLHLKVLTDFDKHDVQYFKAWLYMVAKNHCLMRLRTQRNKQHTSLNEAMPVPNEAIFDRASEEKEKTYVYLYETLQELPQEQKDCVILFYLQKKSYQQVSEQTGYTLMQVKSYIQNGKRNLRLGLMKKNKEL